MDLKEENTLLKKQLEAAQKWMLREVHSAQKEIEIWESQKNKNTFYHKNLEEIIQDKIYWFFPPEALSHFPENAVENIISSELIYYHIIQGGHVDGTWVILWYHKVLDTMIELYITKGFRKYIAKKNLSHFPENSPLEKSLHSIIDKKYILSIWRLFEILSNHRRKKQAGRYESYFLWYLREKKILQSTFLSDSFYIPLTTLIHLHATGEKRHSWSLSPEDTLKAREAMIGNFEDKDCLIYQLAKTL